MDKIKLNLLFCLKILGALDQMYIYIYVWIN